MNLSALFSIEDIPHIVQMVTVILFGLCIGSFLNVVIIRLPRGRSLMHPTSRCGFCRSAIEAWMNIPVVSFLVSGGSCSKCGVAYSTRYPVVEALTAILFFSLWSTHGWTPTTVYFCIFASLLLAMSFIDIDFKIIPDSISIGGWAVALILSLIGAPGFPETFTMSLIGSLLGFGSFWLLSRIYFWLTGEEGLGGGDIKLMGFIGAMMGPRGVVTTILIGSLLGSMVGIIFMLKYQKTKRFPIPFGPFLAIGALAAAFRLDEIWWP